MLAWLHDLNPFLIRFTETLGVRWYGLAYVTGFAMAWMLLNRMSKRGLTTMSTQKVADAMMVMVISVVLGGRLGYVLFYKPHLLWSFDSIAPFWGVLRLNQGGMASHGGILGVIFGCIIISRGRSIGGGQRVGRTPFLHVTDVMALVSPIGLGLGRIANFINGELLGRIVAMPGQPAPWWAIKFPQELLSEHDPASQMSPEARAERAAALARIVEQVRLPSDSNDRGVQRVIEKLQHGAEGIAYQLDPLISARHPSQLYQAMTDGVLLLAVVWIVARRPRSPGVISAWWMISYGVMRIATEFVRLPDADLAVQRFLGFSRGQWYSVLVVLVGVVVLGYVNRKNSAKVGGWGVRHALSHGETGGTEAA